MKMKQTLKWLRTVVVLVIIAGLGPVYAADEKRAALTILHINDVYELSPKRGHGGLAQLMTLLKRERARATNSITTLGGDLISPSVMSGLTKGTQMIEMMNALRVDYAVFGNHEFDFGTDILTQHIAASNFKWLSTNVKGADGKTFMGAEDLAMRQVDELQVGFFGVLTPETTHLSSPGDQTKFTPVLDSAKAAVKRLKEMGADVIIALTHLDLAQDRMLAKSIRGIHIILGGHDHDPISILEGGTLILKSGYDAHYLAVGDITFEKRETRRGMRVYMTPQWRFISTAGVPADEELAAKIAVHEKQLDDKLDVAVGKTSVVLDSRRANVRSKETGMGNLVADALRLETGSDLAFSNGGGIRGNRIYEPGTTLTRKDILGELPFGNVTVVLQMSGAQVRAALENGVSRIEDGAGRFLQVSGLSYTFDAKAAKGERVTAVEVKGIPIDPESIYIVATNNYIANGGDDFKVLKGVKRLVDASGGTLMATMVMDYIQSQGTVAPKVGGRITAKQK